MNVLHETARRTTSRRQRGGRRWFWLLTPFLLLGASLLWPQESSLPPPPKTRTDTVVDVIHGVRIPDPYRWLEDQQSPETRAWINAENRYTNSLLDSWPRRAALKQRLTQLMKIDTIGLPMERGGRYFFRKRLGDQDQGVLCMRKGLEGHDEVLVDPNSLSPDHSVSVNLEDVSRDGTLLAYGQRHGGEDEVAIRLFDVTKRGDLPDRLPKARYFTISIKPDNSGFYYTINKAEGPRVFYHAMGTDPSRDIEVFGKGYGPDKIILADLSEDGRYLILHVYYGAAGDRTDIYFQDMAAHGPIRPIVNDISARFEGEAGGDELFLHTNWKAPKGRILAVDLKNPLREHWREIVPESESAIGSMDLAGGKVLVTYLENAHSRVKEFDASGRYLGDIKLPALGTVASISSRWAKPGLFFDFTSFAIPLTIYRLDLSSGRQSVWARIKVPIRSEDFEVEQVWYKSKDGTRIPMFLVHRRGFQRNGSAPTLLTGYGGFDYSVTPFFSATAALWAEQGGVFAVANLRGGGEFGEAWHRAGMLGKKQNVFDDFIAAAEWLTQNRYTNPSKLAITGASNGGLLVGAALTQRPDLFRAVVCRYPLLDMLRYQKFFVARYWVSEYGSTENPDQFKYLYAYSPYQHVKPGTKYPAVLFVTGDGDTRVAPLHARKMCAELQAANASDRPILIHYDTEAGHSRGLPVRKQIDEATIWMGFLFWQLDTPFVPQAP
jgi:prolyl oligopeptidase